MKINIGSKNPVKVNAVKETLLEYPLFSEAEVTGVGVESGVSDQPKSIQETIQGAKNRALACFNDCDYSVGHESGLIEVPETKTGFMNTDFCVIYDGKEFHVGSAPLFEYPIEAINLVIEKGLDIIQAFKHMGLDKEGDLGSKGGAISVLTNKRLDRKECTKIATRMALIHLENKDLYTVKKD